MLNMYKNINRQIRMMQVVDFSILSFVLVLIYTNLILFQITSLLQSNLPARPRQPIYHLR
jgi:hypothetical protein